MKIFKKIIIGVLGILLIVGGFLQAPVCAFSQKNNSLSYSDFFGQIYNVRTDFKNIKLTEISMLGSHDAFSYDISYSSKVDEADTSNICNNKLVSTLGKGLCVRLAKAQNDSCYQQLLKGVRYFDTRVSYIRGSFYNCHGLVSTLFEENLLEIMRFLDEQPTEFVLIDINHYYSNEENKWQMLEDYMRNITFRGKCIFDYVNYGDEIDSFSKLTYGNLTENGTKGGVCLFASIESDVKIFNQLGFNYSSIWNDQPTTKTLVPAIRETMKITKELGSDYLRINQAQTTPDTGSLWSVITSWSLLSSAISHNYKMLCLDDINEILDCAPIYMCDYATYNDNYFATEMLLKLRDRNLRII